VRQEDEALMCGRDDTTAAVLGKTLMPARGTSAAMVRSKRKANRTLPHITNVAAERIAAFAAVQAVLHPWPSGRWRSL
jgi:hypothetical protein